jgi:hypothetical protein
MNISRIYLSLLIIFIINGCFAQENWETDSKIQRKTYRKAKRTLRKKDSLSAIRIFHYSYIIEKNTKIGRKSFNKFNKLINIEQQKLIKNIKGVWLLKRIGPSWKISVVQNNSIFEDLIIVKKDSLFFYKRNKETKHQKLIKSEKIEFTKITYYSVSSYLTFNYSNNQIWLFKLNSDKSILYLKKDGYFKGNRRIQTTDPTTFYYKRIQQL